MVVPLCIFLQQLSVLESLWFWVTVKVISAPTGYLALFYNKSELFIWLTVSAHFVVPLFGSSRIPPSSVLFLLFSPPECVLFVSLCLCVWFFTLLFLRFSHSGAKFGWPSYFSAIAFCCLWTCLSLFYLCFRSITSCLPALPATLWSPSVFQCSSWIFHSLPDLLHCLPLILNTQSGQRCSITPDLT